jgi:hypothetical protein
MRAIHPGDEVNVVTAMGIVLPKVAVTGPVDGDDFRVVWVCNPSIWKENNSHVSREMAMAWPVEHVRCE